MGRRAVLLAVAASCSLGTASPATAQTPAISSVRVVDVFGHAGWFRAGSDEGTIGHSVAFGGGIALPVWKSIAIELDVQTAAVDSSHRFFEGGVEYRTRRTLVSPSVVYRFGHKTLYAFLGAGFGAEFEDSTSRQTGVRPSGQEWLESEPGVFDLHQSEVKGKISFRGGVSAFHFQNFGVRADVFVAGWHAGARVALGYRFN